ncbi:MAG: aminomethyltransferase family protein [Candidatus Tectimicrobiota bacterium]
MPRSHLWQITQALGATSIQLGEWELPQHFGDVPAEYQFLRQGAGLCDCSDRGLVRVNGKDGARFLHAMVSNDTKSLPPGQGCQATFLTAKGHLIADFIVYAEEGSYLLEMEPHNVQPFITAIDFFVISEDVTFNDETGTHGLLGVQGPRAAELVHLASGRALPDLPMYAHVPWQLAGHDVLLIRRSYTGDDGYLLCTSPAHVAAVWQALWQQRQACGAGPVGRAAMEIARIEAGRPVFGQDMSDETLPMEANLDAALSYTKGCYIGQEVVARVEARGHVNRKLVGLRLQGEALPEHGAKILSPQREVGWITSTAYSPALQQPIALGYVRREAMAPGTALTVQTATGSVEATVAALPLHKSAQ